MYHFIGIYNIVSVIHYNTQQSVMDRVKIIIQRHKNNYFKNWSTQELTFPQYLLQYLLQYYTQVKQIFFKSQYWYTILEQICIPVLCTILVYQYCDRQVQENPLPKNTNFSSCLQFIKLKNNTT